jgi:hypothetical protein
MKSLAALVSLVALLQQAPAQPGQQHVQKVVVNVSDSNGRFLLNMRQQDFIIEEGGVEQKITGFMEGSDVPISLGILVDKSTSMRLPLYVEGREYVPAALLAAGRIGRAVVRLMKPQDEFLLMTFDEKVQVKQNFTQDRKITDAYDTSGKQLEDIRSRIAEQEIQVFTCGLRSVYEEVPDPTAEPLFQLVLRVLSVDTGGLSMIVDLPELKSTPAVEGLIGFAQIIALELRGQYTLSYNTDKTGPLASRFVRVRSPIPQVRIRIRRDAEDPVKPQGK